MQTRQSYKTSRRGCSSKRAFTFTELLVVLLVLGLLLLVLIPAQADSRMKSKSVRCLNNLRQIMGAFMMYTHDNHDLFPPNPDDGNTPGHNWCQGSAGRNGMDEFNPDILMDPQKCLITTYVNTNVSLFRCPSDVRVGYYQGTNVAKIGTVVPAARSISMNQAVGTICPGYDASGAHSGKPTLSVNGPWLDNSHGHRRNSPWRTYGRLSDIIIPGPANLWVIMEEDPNSLNDGGFAFGMNTAEWIDFPSTLHGMSGVITFADGHVEQHKWTDPRTPVVGGNVARRAIPGSADWAWLKDRTSARAQ
jgi:prepilin-type N-terminal cleavage/methylation domain-containing protein